MTSENNIDLTSEWQVLHYSHEKYEHLALLIKLFSVALTVFTITSSLSCLIAMLLLAVLWLQEGVWKTFQARTSARIEAIENAINTNKNTESKFDAFYFYNHWSQNRPTTTNLISSYIKSALKPTVIYPYLPLMIVVLVFS